MDLGDPLWEPCVLDALGCLAQMGTVPWTLLRVMRRWALFVDFSTRFVIGFGAFVMGGAFDIRQRRCICVISGVVHTLCSVLGATLCWSCVGTRSWGTH